MKPPLASDTGTVACAARVLNSGEGKAYMSSEQGRHVFFADSACFGDADASLSRFIKFHQVLA
jgi:hypothetical protein